MWNSAQGWWEENARWYLCAITEYEALVCLMLMLWEADFGRGIRKRKHAATACRALYLFQINQLIIYLSYLCHESFLHCKNTQRWLIKIKKIKCSQNSSQVLFFLRPRGLLTLTLCLWSCISLAPRASYAQRQIYSQKR